MFVATYTYEMYVYETSAQGAYKYICSHQLNNYCQRKVSFHNEANRYISDWICQNPSHMHTMSKNVFITNRYVTPSIS